MFFMNTIKLVAGAANPATIAWVMTLFLVLLAFRYGREAIATFLMKIYELFIQRNPVKL